MKSGQFMCLGTLQHLKNRFSTGYAMQIKVSSEQDVNKIKDELIAQLPGMEILGMISRRTLRLILIDLQSLDQHNEMLFCNVPFANNNQSATSMSTSLACIFQILNQKKEERLIETYALTQTTLEQIFVQLAGEDEDLDKDQQHQPAAKRSKLL